MGYEVFQKNQNINESSVHLTDEDINEIVTAIHDGNDDRARALISTLNDFDLAELIEKSTPEDRMILMSRFIDSFNAGCFIALDDDLRKSILEGLSPLKVAQIVSNLESDDAVDMLYNLEPVFQKNIIRKLSVKNRTSVEEGLTYPEDSAGRLMQREFVAVPQFWNIGQTIDYLRAAGNDLPDEFFDIFVIDPLYQVVGSISLNKIVRTKRSIKIDVLIQDSTIQPIPAQMDQEDVAQIFRREGLVSAPVIDDAHRLIGVITIDDVVDVIDEEAQEDILRLAGVSGGETDMYRDVMNTTKSRFSWLAVNLVTAIMASVVIGLFDATIEQIVALAVLMPIVASMGGNAGTQTLTIAVRALATHDLSRTNMMHMIGKETLIGVINGALFAGLAAGVTFLWFEDVILSCVIGMAMVINLFVAGLFGICIPIVFDRFKIDPALASSVFLTTITDIVGFFAFLGLAAVLLL